MKPFLSRQNAQTGSDGGEESTAEAWNTANEDSGEINTSAVGGNNASSEWGDSKATSAW